MDEELQNLCRENKVDFRGLHEQVSRLRYIEDPEVVVYMQLTAGQLQVIRTCLEVAGGL